jgi:hypothetical protein
VLYADEVTDDDVGIARFRDWVTKVRHPRHADAGRRAKHPTQSRAPPAFAPPSPTSIPPAPSLHCAQHAGPEAGRAIGAQQGSASRAWRAEEDPRSVRTAGGGGRDTEARWQVCTAGGAGKQLVVNYSRCAAWEG